VINPGAPADAVSLAALTGWRWPLIAAGITVAVYLAFVAWLLVAGRREDARALAGFIPDCVVLVRRLFGDDRVPGRHKLLLGASTAKSIAAQRRAPTSTAQSPSTDTVRARVRC